MTMTNSSIVFVGIAPHPPIMVPEVGGEMIDEVSKSVEAMRLFAGRVVGSGAETAVIISPHAPLEADSFVAYADPQLRGEFANFRAPQATVAAECDAELLEAVAAEAARDGYDITPVEQGYARPPPRASLSAAKEPAGPAPTISTSYFSFKPSTNLLDERGRRHACRRKAQLLESLPTPTS